MATVSESERTVDPARAEIVAQVRALGEKGLYLQAYQASREAGPLHAWTGTTETVLAARLAYQLAAPTLANWLVRRAWRADPSDWEARFYNAFRIFRRRGPYWAWRWTAQAGDPDPASPCELQARWHALRGLAAGALRDFTVGESLLDEAIRLAPDCSYAHLCRASLLEYEDRYEDALAVVREVSEERPCVCPSGGIRQPFVHAPGPRSGGDRASRRGLRAVRVRLARGAAARLPDGTRSSTSRPARVSIAG